MYPLLACDITRNYTTCARRLWTMSFEIRFLWLIIIICGQINEHVLEIPAWLMRRPSGIVQKSQVGIGAIGCPFLWLEEFSTGLTRFSRNTSPGVHKNRTIHWENPPCIQDWNTPLWCHQSWEGDREPYLELGQLKPDRHFRLLSRDLLRSKGRVRCEKVQCRC